MVTSVHLQAGSIHSKEASSVHSKAGSVRFFRFRLFYSRFSRYLVSFCTLLATLLWFGAVLCEFLAHSYVVGKLMKLFGLVQPYHHTMATKSDLIPYASLATAPMTSVKLNGKNYVYWSHSVEVFLRGKGLYSHLL